ncbi:MAG: hypothetical protein ABSC94_16540 [Polyangiaceae bacterium]
MSRTPDGDGPCDGARPRRSVTAAAPRAAPSPGRIGAALRRCPRGGIEVAVTRDGGCRVGFGAIGRGLVGGRYPGFLLALAALLQLTEACTTPGSPRLQGTWRGVRSEGVAADVAPIANAFAVGMEIDVRGDSMTLVTAGQRQTGRYRVVREESGAVVVVTDLDGPSVPQTFAFADEDTMKWAVLPGKAIVFSRE